MNHGPNHILNTLIVDDEALARRGLRHRLNNMAGVHIIGEARNGREALAMIRQHHPDLVFLDIQMPGMSGFDVVRELQPAELPAIVFATAFDEYAVKAFEANAVDYILKPIDEERLQEAVQRARERQSARRAKKDRAALFRLVSEITGEPVSSMEAIRDREFPQLKKPAARLAIKDAGKTTWLQQEDIEWIDAAGDYMCVHAGGQTHIMRKTMKELERELDPALMQRVHRSAIVNVKQVREMRSHINGEYFLTLKNGHTLKLSRTYKDKLKFFH
jgi:two-component system LytT family response regulator